MAQKSIAQLNTLQRLKDEAALVDALSTAFDQAVEEFGMKNLVQTLITTTAAAAA